LLDYLTTKMNSTTQRRIVIRKRPLEEDVNPTQLYNIYVKSMITTRIHISIRMVGRDLKNTIEREIAKRVENRCIPEGYVKQGSVHVVSYSCGLIVSNSVEFHVTYTCDICHPNEGMVVECLIKTITKAGIHAEKIDDDGAIPLIVFVSRDHNFGNRNFTNATENQKIRVKIIGCRYEINDPHICVIGTFDSE